MHLEVEAHALVDAVGDRPEEVPARVPRARVRVRVRVGVRVRVRARVRADSDTHLRANETVIEHVCRLLLEKEK